MDAASDIAEFLTSRRARVTPEQAGLPTPEQPANGGRFTFIAAYSAEPGSRSAEALDLLASWAATPEPASTSADE